MAVTTETTILPPVNNEPDSELMDAMSVVVEQQGMNELDADDEEAAEPQAAVQEAKEAVEAPAEAAEKPANAPTERAEYSRKLAEVAKLEWEATQEKKSLKAAQAQAKADLEKAGLLSAKYDKLREVAKKDKFAVLQHLGIDPRDLIQDILQAGGVPKPSVDLDAAPEPAKAAQPSSEVAELRQMVMEMRQAQEATKGERAIADFRIEVGKATEEILKEEAYSSLAALPVENPADTLFDVIREHAERTGALLTVQQAADMVKAAWEEDLARYKSNPKFLELLGAAAKEVKEEVKPSTRSKTLGAKTQTAARGQRKETAAYEEPDIVELANQMNINWGA
jgi:hypothetical protein